MNWPGISTSKLHQLNSKKERREAVMSHRLKRSYWTRSCGGRWVMYYRSVPDSWQSILRNMHLNSLSLLEWPVTILPFLRQVFLLNESSQSPVTFVPIYTALWRREQSRQHYWQRFGYRAGCLRWCCQRYCDGSMVTTEQNNISITTVYITVY